MTHDPRRNTGKSFEKAVDSLYGDDEEQYEMEGEDYEDHTDPQDD